MTDLPPSFAPKKRRPSGAPRSDSVHDATSSPKPPSSPHGRIPSIRQSSVDGSTGHRDLPASYAPESKQPVRRRVLPRSTSHNKAGVNRPSSQHDSQPLTQGPRRISRGESVSRVRSQNQTRRSVSEGRSSQEASSARPDAGIGQRAYPTTPPIRPTRVMPVSDEAIRGQRSTSSASSIRSRRGVSSRHQSRRPSVQAPGYAPQAPSHPQQFSDAAIPPSTPPQQPIYLPAPEPKRPLFGYSRRHFHPVRWFFVLLLVITLIIGGRVYQLWGSVDSQIGRVDATHAGQSTGETWLIAGSDSRQGTDMDEDEVEGERTDSIMVLHKAPNGQASLISLPRDTFVDIPDYGEEKINAAFSYGGAPLLVATVESLTGLHIDHYVQVGMGGVEQMVDAVGGVSVCLDYDVNDKDSGLVWDTTQGECQHVDGKKALAYSRMRKSDPTGDIGRGLRQRAVVSAVVKKALSAGTVLSLNAQDRLVTAGSQALTIDSDDGVSDLISMVLAFRSASNANLTGAPPIESLDYEPGWIGATVLLRDTTAPDFFAKVRDGSLTPDDFNVIDE
ncbi:LCP family protein [Actinomyces vulturis]|uniref:LCP family protein n=1 Tax=Actinomyces vulturis TaxID=1857645 RepID=UPI000AFCEE91|nr:LCP family protein [Actinomyces vulturis]